jgi:hypothetical protein
VELNVWRKSSRSGSNGQCTEVMDTGTDVLVRDSKNPTGPVLAFTRDEWGAFLDGVRAGEFNITN